VPIGLMQLQLCGRLEAADTRIREKLRKFGKKQSRSLDLSPVF